jgi:hypothetical protein
MQCDHNQGIQISRVDLVPSLDPAFPSISGKLHWIFSFFLIAAATGLIRILFYAAYLRPSILVPIVMGSNAPPCDAYRVTARYS